jgi:ribosome-binding factor A
MRRFAKSDKVADLLHHAISNALLQELEDPALRWITVTDVRLSKDLSVAKVYYAVVEPNLTRERAKRALEENLRELRAYLGRNLHLKQTPELRFTFDETLENAEHIEDLLRSLHKEKEPDAGNT